MTNPTNNSDDILKKISLRNWLHNAPMAATVAVMLLLFFTGCTKEQFPLPGGGVGSTPDTWYNLRAFYKFDSKVTDTVYLAGENDWQGDPQWYFMKLTTYKAGASKFKLHQADAGNGWQWWEIDDGYWLSLTLSGSAYRSGSGNKVAWKIIDGKLYTNYKPWKNYAIGAQYYSFLVSPAYYVGMNFGDQYELTGCELVPAQ